MDLDAIGGTKLSLADLAYDAIITGVLDGEVNPGDRLIMDQLAAQLDISRTPVRDALRRLEGEGLLEPTGRRGYVVREVSADEVTQLYHAREAVEGYAARFLTTLPDRAERMATIEAGVVQAEQLNDGSSSGSLFANRRIHRSIVEATGNPYLTAGFDNIWGQSLALHVYVNVFPLDPFAEDVRADHAALIEALAVGSAAEAEQAMLQHINEGLDRNLSGLE